MNAVVNGHVFIKKRRSNMSYDKCQDVRGKILTEVRNEIQRLGITPTLAIIKVNDDFASKKYVENYNL